MLTDNAGQILNPIIREYGAGDPNNLVKPYNPHCPKKAAPPGGATWIAPAPAIEDRAFGL
jgi:hypothetical protein